MSFFQYLTARCTEVNSLLCVGLDPHAAQLEENTAECALSFCRRLVEVTFPYAACYKPNSAFFEALGPAGLSAMKELIASIPDGIPVLLDAKRGDIGSTAEAYASAAFYEYSAHAITLSPYMGTDSIIPFIESEACGTFLLCKTSNPGSNDLQTLPIEGGLGMLYEKVADLASSLNEKDNVGVVIGATDVEASFPIHVSPFCFVYRVYGGVNQHNVCNCMMLCRPLLVFGMLIQTSGC